VVPVHGLAVPHRSLMPLATKLSGHHRVHVVDLPGFGRSGEPSQVLDVAEPADHLAAWLQAAGIPAVGVLQRLRLPGRGRPGRPASRPSRGLILVGPTIDPAARTAPCQILSGYGTPPERIRCSCRNTGWARWTPLNLAGIAAHLAGGAVLTGANKGRLAGQQGAATAATIKTALTVAALGTTSYARLLGKKLERAGDVLVEGGTTPNPAAPDGVTRAQRQLTRCSGVIPVLTGAVLVVNARMGEQQRPPRSPRAWWGESSQVASQP
jgi:hypothetical protein